jgi:hypothetical protein
MRPGMISKECLHILQRRCREVPDELADAWLKLATDYLRPITQPEHGDILDASNFACERLGLPNYCAMAKTRQKREEQREQARRKKQKRERNYA